MSNSSSTWSCCLSAVRRWLRFTWLSRLPLSERGRAWFARPRKAQTRWRWKPAQLRPSLEVLEARWSPNDPLGTLQAPLFLAGLPLVGSGVVSPIRVLVNGWPGGLPAPAAVSEPAVTRRTQPDEIQRASDDDILAVLMAVGRGASDVPGGLAPQAADDASLAGAAPNVPSSSSGPTVMKTDPLGDSLDPLASPKPQTPRWQPPAPGNPVNPHAGADGGGGGYGGHSSGDGHYGGSGGIGGGGNLHLPTLPMLNAFISGGSGSSHAVTTGGGGTAGMATPAAPQATSSTGTTGTTLQPNTAGPQTPSVASPSFSAIAQNFARTPLPYVPNLGQTDPSVNFLAQGPGFGLFLTPTKAVFDVPTPSTLPGSPGHPATPVFDAFAMQLAGANTNPQIYGRNQLPSMSNYFLSNNPSQWHADAPNYATVEYDNVYPGINLVYDSTSIRQFEYHFVVQPGASAAAIQQTWQGVTAASLDSKGNLVLVTPGGSITQQVPQAYQLDASGNRQNVSVNQVVTLPNQVSFSLGSYDHTRPLIIDPSIAYSSFLGGSGTDEGYGIAVDGAGDAYITGATNSTNFPTQYGLQSPPSGTFNIFVTKVNSTGTTLIYSTYFGGGMQNQGNAIAVDPAGNAYITGYASGGSFPLKNAYQSTGPLGTGTTAFVTKLNATGDALDYSTFLGPTGAQGNAIAVDAQGRAYVTGSTPGSFPISGGFQTTYGGGTSDAFITEFTPAGNTVVYSSYLGGSGNDTGTGVAVDSQGNAYITGWTTGSFTTTTGAFQTTAPNATQMGFVSKVNAAGSTLVYSTYLGGNTSDQANAIAVDRSGAAFVTGWTKSTNFPTVGAFQSALGGVGAQNAFVTKLAPSGTTLVYSSYLGGSGTDSGNGIALDTAGDAFVAGTTNSTNFPTAGSPFQSTSGGGNDAFISKVNPAGSTLSYSSYLGGSGDDQATAVAVDPLGNAYLTGLTNSTNFPTVNPFQGTLNTASYDAFVTKVLPTPAAPVFTGLTNSLGAPISGQVTNVQQLKIQGTAAANATVTLYRRGSGQIGTTTANASGNWTFDYTGTTLPEGVAPFTATATVNSLTSPPASDYLVTIDLTAPALTASVPASTTSLAPQVRVVASDLNSLPNGTSVAIDLFSGGVWTNNYATGTLTDGVALITLPALAAIGSYSLRAHVTDRAGNQATSATQSFQVTSVSSPWTPTGGINNPDPGDGMAQQQIGDVQVTQLFDLNDRLVSYTSDCGCGGDGGDAALVYGGGDSSGLGSGYVGHYGLAYHADSTGVHPVLQISLTSDNSTALPATITGTLTWDSGAQVTTGTWNTTGANRGDVLILSIPVPNAVTTTGWHDWTLQLNTPAGIKTISSSSLIVSQDASPFGAGWSFAPVDQLISLAAHGSQPAGILHIYGSGGYRFFPSNGLGGYTSPAGDNGTLSFAANQYTYQTPDGRQWLFNSGGYQLNWISADGQSRITFAYDVNNHLTNLTAVDGTLSTFTYAVAQPQLLQSIQTVNGRTTNFAYSGTQLTQITNADGSLHTFSYDSQNHLTSETLGAVQNQWAYSSAGTVGTITWGAATGPGGQTNASVTTLTPAMVQGLAPAGGTGTVAVGTPLAVRTDPNSHTTKWQLDSQGRLLTQYAADGGVTQYQYNNGFLTSLTDPLGRTTTYARDASQYVTQETLPDGNTVTMQYQTAFHALTTMTDERGNTTTSAYDSQGHLTSRTDASGQRTSYTYTTNGLVQSVTDPLLHTVTYQYDSQRRLTQTSDPSGNLTTVTYDANGFPSTVKDARGNITTTSYDVMGRLTQTADALNNLMTMTYDPSGLELSSTDSNNNVTSLVYDGFSRGLLAQTIRASGSGVQTSQINSFDNAGQVSLRRNAAGWWVTSSYDPDGRPQTTTDASSEVATSVYDLAGQQLQGSNGLGQYTKQVYNARGWVTQSTDALGNVTTSAYDQAGNLTAVTDPLSHTTTTVYDKLNRATVVTDALSHSTTTTYDAAGNVSTVTDANSHVTSYVYDANNRRVTETDAVGTTVQRMVTFAYDKVGNQTAVTDGLGHTTTSVFDQDNRVTAVIDALGHTSTTVYDPAGNVTQSIDGLGKTTTYVYNALNQQVAVIDPLGHITTSMYDGEGQRVATIDAVGNMTQYVFDSQGRPIATVSALGGVNQTVYDAAGNTAAVIDAVGNQTSYVYDALNREVRHSDAYGTVTTSYDSASRVTAVTDANSRTITFSYDNVNRETGETWKSSSGVVLNTLTYTFDNVGNQLTAANNAGTYTFTYDALNRKATQKDVYGLTLTYTLDAADRLTLRQDSLGGTLTSVYDNADRLTSRKLTAGTQALRIDPGYNNRNDLTSLTRYADVGGTQPLGTTAYGIDDAGRVTSIVNKNSSSATLSYYNYTFDNADRVASVSWNSQVGTVAYSGSHMYAYDATNQLLGDGTSTYTYDLNGNRTMSGYQTAAGNRLTTDGTWTYTYDAVGDLIQKVNSTGTTWAYSYDDKNHLLSATQTVNGVTSMVASYTYDVFDNLIQEQHWTSATGTVTLRHAYDGANVWADVNTSNAVLARYVAGDAQAQLWARMVPSGQTNPGVAWYFTDRLGSVVDLMDSTQSLKDHIDYAPYGKIVTEANASFADAYKYDSGRTDGNTGLVQFGERWYDPVPGRWTSQDPLGLVPDSNPYRYVDNAPVLFVDPVGEGKIVEKRINGRDVAAFLPPNEAKIASVNTVNFGNRAGNNYPKTGKTENFVSLDIIFYQTKPIHLEFYVENSKGRASYWYEFHVINSTPDTWKSFSFQIGSGVGANFKKVRASWGPQFYVCKDEASKYVPLGAEVKPFKITTKTQTMIELSDGMTPPGPTNGFVYFQNVSIPDAERWMDKAARTEDGYKFTIMLEPKC